MSDFRIRVGDALCSPARELDWDEGAGTWSASERDWDDLRWVAAPIEERSAGAALREFFVLRELDLGIAELLAFSPMSLAAAHARTQADPSVYARLCRCGLHTLVTRFEGPRGWVWHGRDCSSSWHRGTPLGWEGILHLAKARRLPLDKALREPRA